MNLYQEVALSIERLVTPGLEQSEWVKIIFFKSDFGLILCLPIVTVCATTKVRKRHTLRFCTRT